MIKNYQFFKEKYGSELLIDLIRLESLEKYIIGGEPHILSYYDITLISNGIGEFLIDTFTFPILKNSIFISSPGQIRSWKITEVPKGLVLIFEEEFLCTFFNDLQFVRKLGYFNNNWLTPVINLSNIDYNFLLNLMLQIEDEIKSFPKNDTHILRALLYQVLIWVKRKFNETYQYIENEDINRHVKEFIDLVNKEFKQNHTVGYYANLLNITSGHLNDLAKEFLSENAKQYILNRILLEAKRLLFFSDLSVSEIAWQLNFQDLSYFVRIFKKHTGETPLHFRKNKIP